MTALGGGRHATGVHGLECPGHPSVFAEDPCRQKGASKEALSNSWQRPSYFQQGKQRMKAALVEEWVRV